VQDLQPPDTHYLNAAAGWLELGNSAEAMRELAHVSVTSRSHPAALELRWQICAHDRNWAEALEAARQLVAADGNNPSGWIHQSYSLHELKRTGEARECLLPLVERFPNLSTIPYNLACYACQLTKLPEARKWLKRAFERGAAAARASFATYAAAAELAHRLGLGINAGHDLNLDNLTIFRDLPHLDEVSIGHAIMSRALFVGLDRVVREYLAILSGRHPAGRPDPL
jgi:tetratricopeptide (TPR) repeat protein